MRTKNISIKLRKIQKRIAKAIQTSVYNQKTIAENIGVSEQTVSKYINKNIFPSLETLSKLCAFLDVSADYILGLTDY